MAFSTPDTHITGYVVTAADWNELVNNDLAINSFFRQNLWPDYEAHAPLSGITAAGISIVESSGAGTAKPIIPIIGFIGTADEGRMWTCRWPRGYGVTATLVGSYYMTGANTDDEAVMVAQIAAVSDGDTSQTAKVFDSANSLTHTVPDAAGTADEFSITLTNADSIAAIDWVCVVLWRDGDNGSDTANVGDLALTSLAIDFDLAS
jgi:hypothetical protein